MEKNIIVELSTAYALRIIDFSEVLESKKKFVVAKQILRSGTSIGANVRESQNAESKADFIHKLKIAAKEASELQYWIELCSLAKSYLDPDPILFKDLHSIINNISKIIISSKQKPSNSEG